MCFSAAFEFKANIPMGIGLKLSGVDKGLIYFGGYKNKKKF